MTDLKIEEVSDRDFDGLDSFSCCYVLYNSDAVPIYVGSTSRLSGRLHDHTRSIGSDFHKFSYERCKPSEMFQLEAETIVKMKPLMNIRLPVSPSFISRGKFIIHVTGVFSDMLLDVDLDFDGRPELSNKHKYISTKVMNEIINNLHKCLPKKAAYKRECK